MGDQLQAALLAVDEPLEQLAEVEEIYVRFVLAHTVGFDLIFAAELRSSDDDDLRAAGRRVIDLMMKPGIEVSPDLGRALELTEEFWTTAHGYATLFLTGFYVHDADYVVAAARRTARRLGPCGPLRTLTIVSEDSGRKYGIPDDPADRPVRTRRAVRVIVVGPDDRVLLFEDSDPGIAGVTWWVTPGGGIDPGETERQTAVREMAEETGYVLAEDELVGPLATRYAVHGYSDQVLEQRETFYLVRVATFEIDISAHTEEEQITLQGHRWWTRSEIEAGGAWIWPAQLLELWDRAAEPSPTPLQLGRQEESTVPI